MPTLEVLSLPFPRFALCSSSGSVVSYRYALRSATGALSGDVRRSRSALTLAWSLLSGFEARTMACLPLCLRGLYAGVGLVVNRLRGAVLRFIAVSSTAISVWDYVVASLTSLQEQTQDEEEQLVEGDAELGDVDKERETSKANEGQTLEKEEEEQMEADAGLEDRLYKEQKKSGEKRKDEAHEKDKEKNQDEDGSMSNSEKLDKLIQMVYDLGKRVEIIQNVLGVKVPDGSSNKQDYENAANFFDDTKGASNDENEEEANPGDKRNAADDGNDEEIIDEEAISATQQLTEVNTIGENEITEKITQDEETEKMENESFKKQKSQVTSPTPTYTTPKFDLLSQESRSSIYMIQVLMRDVGEKSEFQPLIKTKKRSVQQDNQVNDDAESPVKKKNKGDIGDVALRRSERGQIPSIHTQPPFTGARKKNPIIHPFEPVDKSRKEKMTEWKMSNKNKKHTLIINNVRVNAKWFSDLETPGRKLLKTHIEAGLEPLKTRKRNNPDLFLNKTALVVGVKFLEEIEELYDEFLDDKEGFQFESGFGKYNIEKNINVLYSAIEIEEKYWLGIVVNLEKRSVTAFNSAAVKFTDANIRAYVNAYAMVLPFMLRNIFKDVNVDTSKFDINVVSEDYPQVLKIEDSGVYALKLIECHAMRIVDFTKLSEEKTAFIREKLAVDIFSELQ
ncbi:hypothetical protein Bca52824_033115 [Brassica carinata]|uniref:Ubiquitin-like protease family profile domain-containing protein n=1 Tax=Brassica carinata TaxID=52824 RepID=A0A8X7SI78_BRACI|nr:hypothetical protein Bca52824_033115 [Brassica carinata]